MLPLQCNDACGPVSSDNDPLHVQLCQQCKPLCLCGNPWRWKGVSALLSPGYISLTRDSELKEAYNAATSHLIGLLADFT